MDTSPYVSVCFSSLAIGIIALMIKENNKKKKLFAITYTSMLVVAVPVLFYANTPAYTYNEAVKYVAENEEISTYSKKPSTATNQSGVRKYKIYIENTNSEVFFMFDPWSGHYEKFDTRNQ